MTRCTAGTACSASGPASDRHYRAPELGGRNVMHMPFSGGMRIDLQCLPGDDPEQLASADGLRDWIGKVVDPWYALDHARPTDARRVIGRCASQRQAWGRHNRDISSRGLNILRGDTPAMRAARSVAARLSPGVCPAGAWLANGPLKVPVPRPRHGS
jgi:hypothetical protein